MEHKTYFKTGLKPKKHCNVGNCTKPIWSHGECQMHSKISSHKKKMELLKPTLESLDKWYNELHNKFGGVCQETGAILSFDKKHCLHLLPKSLFPEFKFDLENGLLASWATHDVVDKGSSKQRQELKCWSFICERRKKLLESKGYDYDEEYWLSAKF